MSCFMNDLVSFMFIFTKYVLCMFLNYVCFTHFGLFDVAKGERKMGILRNQDVIFSRLKISINSKRKGEKGMSER